MEDRGWDLVKPGDQVLVRVIGLGSYKRKWHDTLAKVLEVNHRNRTARVMFEGEEKTFSFDVIELVNEESAENNKSKR